MIDLREELCDYLNGISKENELLSIAEITKCTTCDEYILEEYAHENEDGTYCDTCWEARN